MVDVESKKYMISINREKYLVNRSTYLIHVSFIIAIFVFVVLVGILQYLHHDTSFLIIYIPLAGVIMIISNIITVRNLKPLNNEEVNQFRLGKLGQDVNNHQNERKNRDTLN